MKTLWASLSFNTVNTRRANYISGALLVIVTTWIYGGVRDHEFLNFDDGAYIVDNPPVRAGLTLATARWALTAVHSANWHPLTWLSHALDIEMFGLRAGCHLMENVVFHAANSVLLLVFIQRAFGWQAGAFLVAAFFAWHPMHVESVAWAAERKDVLSTFLGFLAFIAYDAWVRKPRWYAYAGLTGSFLLALLSKPMLVTLPCVLFLLDFYPYRRLNRRNFPRRALEKAPLFFLSAASCAITVVAQRSAMSTLDRLPLPTRLENAAISYIVYLRQFFWPHPLANPYPYDPATITLSHAGIAILISLAITAFTVWLRKCVPGLLMGWLWYLGTLVPVIGILQVGPQAHADRYTYMPYAGLSIMLAGVLTSVGMRRAWMRPYLFALSAAVLLVFAFVAHAQVAYWQNSETLFRHALAVTQDNYVARNNLGEALLAKGDAKGAEPQFREALAIHPGDTRADYNLGCVLLEQGRFTEAAAILRKVVSDVPDDAEAWANLGMAMLQSGNLLAGRDALAKAAALSPENVSARINLGVALMRLGESANARHEFQAALALDPDNPAARENLRQLSARAH